MKGIQKIEADREARRAKMQQEKQQKADRKLANENAGRKNDVEYDLLVDGQKVLV